MSFILTHEKRKWYTIERLNDEMVATDRCTHLPAKTLEPTLPYGFKIHVGASTPLYLSAATTPETEDHPRKIIWAATLTIAKDWAFVHVPGHDCSVPLFDTRRIGKTLWIHEFLGFIGTEWERISKWSENRVNPDIFEHNFLVWMEA